MEYKQQIIELLKQRTEMLLEIREINSSCNLSFCAFDAMTVWQRLTPELHIQVDNADNHPLLAKLIEGHLTILEQMRNGCLEYASMHPDVPKDFLESERTHLLELLNVFEQTLQKVTGSNLNA